MPFANPLKIYFDGGARPNPGKIEAAVVARGRLLHFANLGEGTNNDAEWLALLKALDVALAISATDIVLLGDSRLVVGQANSMARPGPALRHHHAAYAVLVPCFTRVRVKYLRRTQNLAGIALAARHPR